MGTGPKLLGPHKVLVLMHPVTVHQSTSGLMEETGVHSNTRSIGPKSHLPNVAGNSPWGKNILQAKQGRAPMLLRQMNLTGSDRALPHRAPFDWATPQLSHLQMDVGHMDIQCRLDPHLTDRAKTRGIVAKRPVGPMPSTTDVGVPCPVRDDS